jgi:3-methyladenine DNA glycosylase AlkD
MPSQRPEPTAAGVRRELASLADPARAAHSARFFQAFPGGYGEGDTFLGIRVPDVRRVVRGARGIAPAEAASLVDDDEHEHRLAGLLLLVDAYARRPGERDEILDLYLSAVRRGRVDNWDLVDSSSEYLLGASLLAGTDADAVTALREWGDPGELWWRRVALLATFAFVKACRPAPTLDLAARYLDDRRDLVQKATGWMLREVGKRVDEDLLVAFLDRHAPRMGRTALSYAIERLSPEERRRLRGLS